MRKILYILAFLLLCTGSLRAVPDDRKNVALENGIAAAVLRLDGGDLQGALSALEALDRQFPDNDAVNYFLGLTEAALKHPDRVEQYLQKAVRLNPVNTDYLDALAAHYQNTQQNEKATAIYLDLLERFPQKYSNAYTLTLLADRQMASGKDSLALASYERALLYDPGYAPALLGKSELHRMKGRFPDFFASVTPLMSDPYLAPSAKAGYLKALMEHVDGSFYQVWGGQLDSLVNICTRVHPSDSSTLRLAGSWYYGTGRKEQGEALFDRFLSAFPQSADAHFIRVQLLSERSDWEGVVAECQEILNLKGIGRQETVQAYSVLGDTYYTLKDKKNAYASYERALKLDPGYVPVLNNYAYYLSLEAKNLPKAEKMSKITIEKEPDNPTYLDTYGWILHLRGRSKQAKPYFKHAMLYGGKESAVILKHYALVLDALGEKELAGYYHNLADTKK
ncbi:MAG: tetratricopeptide repeat protein [Bacteroidales bacterium]|nr:tetratricopeptide repeat protein [Bacteroidales bacterium]